MYRQLQRKHLKLCEKTFAKFVSLKAPYPLIMPSEFGEVNNLHRKQKD